MFKKIAEFFKRIPKPSVYFIFPGRSDRSPKDTDDAIYIPNQPALIVDTSALIDGRIADIVKTGFISGTFIIPNFILNELQQVADSKDPVKRNRGRRGLDVLRELRYCKFTKFKVVKLKMPAETVDESLLIISRKLKGRIITTDYNLNKVAKITGVQILNVNELANTVKTIMLPNEEFAVSIIRVGKEKNQGVGYLPDGTMVVIEQGEKLIGSEVKARVDRIFQTNAGRMIFAKVVV